MKIQWRGREGRAVVRRVDETARGSRRVGGLTCMWICVALLAGLADGADAKTNQWVEPSPCEAYFKVYTQQDLAPESEKYSPIGGTVYPVLYVRLGAASRVAVATTTLTVSVQDMHEVHINQATGERDPATIAELGSIDLAAGSGWERLTAGTWAASGGPAAYDNQYGEEKVLYRYRMSGWDTCSVPMGHNGRHQLLADSTIQFEQYDGGWEDPTAAGPEAKATWLGNLVVLDYYSSNGAMTSASPRDYLKYDPDGPPDLSRPTIVVRVADADPGMTACAVWLRRTGNGEWGEADPYLLQQADLSQGSGEHTFTFTWNGAYRPSGTEDEAPWGTYTYDVVVTKGAQTFWAKRPYLISIPETITIDEEERAGHDVWFDEEQSPAPLICDYYLEGAAEDEPSSVTLYGLDGDLRERGTVAGLTAMNQLHTGPSGTGIVVAHRSEEVAVPEWRVVFTAELPAAVAAERRDHKPPRMLAVNDLAGHNGCYQFWVHSGSANNLNSKLTEHQWMYLDANVYLLSPPGSELYERKIESLKIDTAWSGGTYTWGFLKSDQKNRAAKKHVTTSITAEDQPSIDGAGGRAPNTRGTDEHSDRIFVSLIAISEANQGHDSAYLLPNCILHEIGHTCDLAHGAAGTPNVMGASISGNPAMFEQLYVFNDGKSAWGPGFHQDTEGRWKVDGGTPTAINITSMRKHCGIK